MKAKMKSTHSTPDTLQPRDEEKQKTPTRKIERRLNSDR
jgi:hypothetical protein